jgi:hypothetical protein
LEGLTQDVDVLLCDYDNTTEGHEMQTIQIECTDTGKKASADVIKQSNKELVVAIAGSIRLVLRRSDLRKPYVGNYAGMEFTHTA